MLIQQRASGQLGQTRAQPHFTVGYMFLFLAAVSSTQYLAATKEP